MVRFDWKFAVKIWQRIKDWANGHDDKRLKILPFAWGFGLLAGGASELKDAKSWGFITNILGISLWGFSCGRFLEQFLLHSKRKPT